MNLLKTYQVLIGAVIIALGLAWFVIGNRFEITSADRMTVVRLDRWTGETEACSFEIRDRGGFSEQLVVRHGPEWCKTGIGEND